MKDKKLEICRSHETWFSRKFKKVGPKGAKVVRLRKAQFFSSWHTK